MIELGYTLMILLWDMFIVAGTIYLIQVHKWSPWWILLALLLVKLP